LFTCYTHIIIIIHTHIPHHHFSYLGRDFDTFNTVKLTPEQQSQIDELAKKYE